MDEGKHCPFDERTVNPDGKTKVTIRPIALLEALQKLVESVAVDQHADHIIALMQEQGERRG